MMAMTEGERSARLVREIFLAGFMSGLPAENVAWATHRLARNMTDVHLKAGDVLYRQGDSTTSHYFVVYGEILLVAEGVPPWKFGERSLIGTIDLTLDRPRSRTATATRDTHLLSMPGSDWLDMLEDNFELMLRGVEGLAQGVHALRVGVGGGVAVPEPPTHPAAQLVLTQLPANGELGLAERVLLLRGVTLFSKAEVQALLDLAAHAVEVDFDAGKTIVGPGEPNEAMFVTLSGAVSASTSPAVPEETFGPGTLVFGSRAATSKDLGFEAHATTKTRLLRIMREDYFDAMEEHFALARSSMKALAAEREALANETALRARALSADAPPG
jgi:CRP-like cAMP-binding protein